jgi:hypothetical protein
MNHNRRRFVSVLAVLIAAGLCASSATSSPTVARLVSLWHMNETSGTTMHDSVSRNNGTASHVSFGVPGLNGKAYAAQGIGSLVTVPNSPSLNPGAASFSFGLSVRFTTVPKTGYDLFRKGFRSTKGGFFKLEAVSKHHHTAAQARCLFAGSAGASRIVGGPNLADGAWHTVTCSRTADGITLTIDGQTFTKAGPVGSISNTASLTLAAKLKGIKLKHRYVGSLDEASFSVSS